MLVWLLFETVWACTLSVSTPGECRAASELTALDFCLPYFTGEICIPVGSEADLAVQRDVELQGLYGTQLGVRLQGELNGVLPQSFSRISDCKSQYHQLLCLVNFPRCQNNSTAPVCRSFCEGLISTCGLPEILCHGMSQDSEVCADAAALALALWVLNC